MRISIYQPRYFPQLHYFNRVFDSDTFVILDSAQYTKSLVQTNGHGRVRQRSYQSDSPIKLPSGTGLLTVPLRHAGIMPISDTTVDYNQKWQLKHLLHIKVGYKYSSHFDTVSPHIKELLTSSYESLADLNIATFVWAATYILGGPVSAKDATVDSLNSLLSKADTRLKTVIRSKDLGVTRPDGLKKGTEWTTAICHKLSATEYIHGGTAKDAYMNLNFYKKEGIKTLLQDWKCSKYPQQYEKKLGFISNLSILDLLFNVEQKKAKKILGI